MPVNRNQEFDTAKGMFTRAGTYYAPYGSQTISATVKPNSGFTAQLTGADGKTYSISPSGDSSQFTVTTPSVGGTLNWSSSITHPWPAAYTRNSMYMPALWTISFSSSPSTPCFDPNTPPTATPPFTPLPNPQVLNNFQLLPGVGAPWVWYDGFWYGSGTPALTPPPIAFTCFVNTPANPQINPVGVSPRFALDDYLPNSVQEVALQQINAQPQYTFLHMYSPDMSTVATVPAISVDPSGMSATFAYPRQLNGASLPAGGYISTITTDIPGQSETTNSIEPMVIGHDNTSYPGAFGIAYVAPQTVYTNWGADDIYGDGSCQGTPYNYVYTDGVSGPVVSSVTQNKVILPNNTSVSVGVSPTVVIPLNFSTDYETAQDSRCDFYSTQYNGPQSVLVVNTGSASVSIVQIGDEPNPAGTVAVGNQPVAAVLGPNGFVYVANYADGTISEVNTSALLQTRVLHVMPHPASVSFDTNGNLWVGGQGAVDKINLTTWAVSSTQAVDGTVSQMAFSKQQNAMVQVLLQNGTVASPSNGSTVANAIAYSSMQSSYSSATLVNTSTGAAVTPQLSAVSNAAYVSSPIASQLAFPAQTAFVPATLSGSSISSPLLSSVSGDVVAVANANSFTISSLPTGEPLISGTLPYPIRGVTIGGNTIYFTMTESNSVITVPLKF